MDKFALLSKLVSFDTTSRNSNLECIEFIKEHLESQNIKSTLTFNSLYNKANLFATIPSVNNTMTGGFILSGHTDVVPVDGQKWNTNPFCATQQGDLIYGRGTCDMKGFIAVALSLVPKFLGMKLQKPVHLAFSYDEEIGCAGVPSLIEDLFIKKINPEACLVGEPTSMVPVIAHKGINVFRCRILGKASHSSLTQAGCNAIDYAARLICKIREIAEELRIHGKKEAHYDVPYSTMSTNLIQGGIAMNTVPEYCEFIFELRNLPHLKPQRILEPILNYVKMFLLPQMQQEYSLAKIEIDTLAAAPGLIEVPNSTLTQLATTLTKSSQTLKVAYATEAGLFQNKGIPTIVCGPGNIQEAHRANEFVSQSQMNVCENFLLSFAKEF